MYVHCRKVLSEFVILWKMLIYSPVEVCHGACKNSRRDRL